jgi:hypothetical protein
MLSSCSKDHEPLLGPANSEVSALGSSSYFVCDPGAFSGFRIVSASGGGGTECCITFQARYPSMVGSCVRVRTANSSLYTYYAVVPTGLTFEVCVDNSPGFGVIIETVACGGIPPFTPACNVFDDPCE